MLQEATIELIPVTGTGLSNASNFSIFTNASFYNLIINRSSSTSAIQIKHPNDCFE